MPFSGVRVLDLSDRLSGAFAARLFGDHGADVVLIEGPEGHPIRRRAPFAANQRSPNSSVVHAYANWNKRSVTIASNVEPDSELNPVLAAALDQADVVVTTGANRAVDNRIGPATIHLSITAHGLTGPLASVPGTHLTSCARVGWTTMNALDEEAPLQLPVNTSDYLAGVNGFIGAAAALWRRNRTGAGERIDVSELEVLELTTGPWALASVFRGVETPDGPMGRRDRDRAGPLFQTSDGTICLGFGDWKNWPDAMRTIGLDEFADDEALVPDFGRHQQDLSTVAHRAQTTVAGLERWPLFHQLGRLRCLSGCLQTTADLLEDEQLGARSFFVETIAGHRPARAPGFPARYEPPLWRLADPAPELRATAPDLPVWPTPDKTEAAPRAVAPTSRPDPHDLPLAGLRALSFTQAWSGTLGTQLLALLGADVVQIELLHKSDVWRNSRAGVPAAVVDPGRRQIAPNTQGLYNSVNLNKRAIALDMSRPEGRELFWRVMPGFDLVADNFAPSVMTKWGITLQTLAEKRPDVIFASISGFGHGGTYTPYPANGSSIEPMAGLSSVHGYGPDEPMNTGGLLPDPVAAHFFAAAVVAAIHQRDRTGGPQRVDVSMMETVAALIGDAIVEHDATGVVRRPDGNRHPDMAPHGIFPTNDGWLALAVETDGAWQALASRLGLADDARLTTLAGRKTYEETLEATIRGWLATKAAGPAADLLAADGVSAAVVATPTEVFTGPEPHMTARGFLTTVEHPESGSNVLMGSPWLMASSPVVPLRPAPGVGQHSREVLTGELGLSDQEYERLVAAGITGTL